ncbi:MAG: TIGR01777 family oxidoreductase [Bacteroidota bacterium]
MKIIAAGVTGFIGTALLRGLVKENHDVTVLTRNPDATRRVIGSGVTVEEWDAQSVGAWAHRVEGADAIINLTGEPIAAKRWSTAQKNRIRESRVNSTRAIVEAIRQCSRKPSVLINASAVGYYGAVAEGDVVESKEAGKGFLAETCGIWEQEARTAEALGVRVVLPRTGVVIGESGGALAKMVPPFTFFVGGPIGNGRQWFPWIHRDDVVGAIIFALGQPGVRGPMNLAAPESATMKEFCTELGNALHRPSWAPVPGFVLRLALGEMADMLLTGQRAVPQQLLKSGYKFKFPTLGPALADIFRR